MCSEKLAVAAALQQLAGDMLHMPVGVGIDVVDLSDFERLSGGRFSGFYQRCFSEREIAYCRAQARPAQQLHVSLSHAETWAAAIVVAVKKDRADVAESY